MKILKDRGTTENGDGPLKDAKGASPPPISKDRGRLPWILELKDIERRIEEIFQTACYTTRGAVVKK